MRRVWVHSSSEYSVWHFKERGGKHTDDNLYVLVLTLIKLRVKYGLSKS